MGEEKGRANREAYPSLDPARIMVAKPTHIQRRQRCFATACGQLGWCRYWAARSPRLLPPKPPAMRRHAGKLRALLTRNPPDEDPAVLSCAILAVVRAGVPEDLDRLATYMQSYVFGEDFAVPPEMPTNPSAGTCAFKELMRSIAECDTAFAEELLVLYARSIFDAERAPRDRAPRLRRAYIFLALGCLHPKTNGTYSLLDKELDAGAADGSVTWRNTVATERLSCRWSASGTRTRRRFSAGKMFRDSLEWAGALNLDIWLSCLAKESDKPAELRTVVLACRAGVTAKVQGRNPAERRKLQEQILKYLVERQIVRGTGDIIFEYPGYDNVPVATRDKLLKVVSAADRTKFSREGR